MPFHHIKIHHVVTLGDCIYVLALPDRCYGLPFERYNAAYGHWESLNPFPSDAVSKLGSYGYSVQATAVWKDTILFNMVGRQIWAYDVKRDKWCSVRVVDKQWCCSIKGEAVVLDNTIYALTTQCVNSVLALSIQRDDIRFVCSLLSKISLPHTNAILSLGAKQRTSHLVHLGEDNFCLVQSCKFKASTICYHNYNQPIKLTNFKLIKENNECSMTLLDECVHLVRIPYYEPYHVQFCIQSCFSLPVSKPTALREGKNFCFNLDPFPDDFDPKEKLKTDTDCFGREFDEEFETQPEDGPLVNVLSTFELLAKSNATSNASTTVDNGDASEMIYTDAEGHSIYVRNLLPDATFGQFEEEMKKFGPTMGFGIKFIIDDDTVSATIIEGSRADMEEMRRIGLIVGREGDEHAYQVSTIITEDYQAEMEEDRKISSHTVDTVSDSITGVCQEEMEEERICQEEEESRQLTEDMVSAMITEGSRAEMEEKRRIGIIVGRKVDEVSTIITEGCQAQMEEERRIPSHSVDSVSDFKTGVCQEEIDEERISQEEENRRHLTKDVLSALITQSCQKVMGREKRIDLSENLVSTIMAEVWRAEMVQDRRIVLTLTMMSCIIAGDFDAEMMKYDKMTSKKQKERCKNKLRKKVSAMITKITGDSGAAMEEKRRIVHIAGRREFDKVSSLITVVCRAEMEEESRIRSSIDWVSARLPWDFKEEMEEIMRTGVVADKKTWKKLKMIIKRCCRSKSGPVWEFDNNIL